MYFWIGTVRHKIFTSFEYGRKINTKKLWKKLYLGISLIGLWIFFTHLYGIIVSNPEKIEENFDSIHEDFNGTSFQSNEDLFNSTNLNQSEIIDVQKKYLYREGLSTAAKLMMLYPIGAVGFSAGFYF